METMHSEVTLHQMRLFVAVAEELHFGRAAERLYMSQPPLSRQIRTLEENVGVQLLDRTTRSVRLTRAGEAFLQEVRQVLAGAARAQRVATGVAAGTMGVLRIGYIEAVALDILPRVLPRYRRIFPGVELELREMHSTHISSAMRDGEVDIGIVRLPVDQEGLEMEWIAENPFVAAVWDDHPLEAGVPDTSALAKETFLTYSQRICVGVYTATLQICTEAGFVPNIRGYASSTPELMSLIAAREGISLVPVQFSMIPWIGVKFARLPGSAPTSTIAVVWREGTINETYRRFVDEVKLAVQAPVAV
ncbi:MAG: LysR family transcriptional regulator [Thermomicrobiales bacterium]|nr:LysR family transcriptional regulator [Thermomicrobiales bacterium]